MLGALQASAWQFDENPIAYEGPLWFSPHRMESLRPFLAVSEEFAKLGIKHYAHVQKTPTLNPRDLWRVPKDLELPEVAFTSPPLEDWVVEALTAYKPPQL